jgi:hypothetical protein
LVVQAHEPTDDAGRAAKSAALRFLKCSKRDLDQHWAGNEQAWAWFHAARREELRLRSRDDLALVEIDLNAEALQKLRSWRRKSVEGNPGEESVTDQASRIEQIIRVQTHLDHTFENDNRKRLLQRGQMIIYLAVLVSALLLICLVEFLTRGLLLADDDVNGWWVVSAALYGILGGAFSSAQRVARAGPSARFPELRWAQLANGLRPFAGGAGALIAFAALQTGVLGDAGQSGPRVALFSFVAGFSERFIPSLVAGLEPKPESGESAG